MPAVLGREFEIGSCGSVLQEDFTAKARRENPKPQKDTKEATKKCGHN